MVPFPAGSGAPGPGIPSPCLVKVGVVTVGSGVAELPLQPHSQL